MKKTERKAEVDTEILQIQHDFQQIVGEMTDLTCLAEFSDIFRQLHKLIMDTHQKNNLLTSKVQSLQQCIVTNATKVASLLKMSEDDQNILNNTKKNMKKHGKLLLHLKLKNWRLRIYALHYIKKLID